MPNIILTTVGSSIIENFLLENKQHRLFYEREIEFKEINDGYPQEIDTFRKMLTENAKREYPSLAASQATYGKRLSAEIITLHIMKQNDIINPEDDRVILFFSDTLEGQISADENEEILKEKAGFRFLDKKKLPRVKGNDAKGFTDAVNDGSIVDIFLQEMNTTYTPMICFSGGYKGLLPVLSNLAKKNEVNMYYLFEKSEHIVEYNYSDSTKAQARNITPRGIF